MYAQYIIVTTIKDLSNNGFFLSKTINMKKNSARKINPKSVYPRLPAIIATNIDTTTRKNEIFLTFGVTCLNKRRNHALFSKQYTAAIDIVAPRSFDS